MDDQTVAAAPQRLIDPHQRFGGFMLVLVAVGLGGYCMWRLLRAALGHGPEASDGKFDRLAGLASGLVYGVLCFGAINVVGGFVVTDRMLHMFKRKDES